MWSSGKGGYEGVEAEVRSGNGQIRYRIKGKYSETLTVEDM